MSFCCPPGWGCNHVHPHGGFSGRGECYRQAVARCVDPGLAEVAESWAQRTERTWLPWRRLRYRRRYRHAVAQAFEIGIGSLKVRAPTGLPPAKDPRPAILDELRRIDVEHSVLKDVRVREAMDKRKSALLERLDRIENPVPHFLTLSNPPPPPW